ncbi:MAG: acetate kinase [Oscillospiraceae bacterium]|nr:acetate kinase [Oscillospiraceae bacterium]
MNVLVINAGSSSLKYQLFDMETEKILAKGLCDRIGIDGHLKHKPTVSDKKVFDEAISLPTHAEAISIVIDKLTSDDYGVISCLSEINAVGHRAVHGGRKFFGSALINDEVIMILEDCIRLAPLHIPANLMGIRACQIAMPGVPQVAVFDTAFHHTIPEHAYIYPIPYKYYEENDIRRYGFHGSSHRYVSAIALEHLNNTTGDTKLITCHLGNGSSLAAVKNGKSIDTTMGVTPLEGVPMGTRCGSVDPSLVDIIAAIDDLSIKDTMDILNKKSGVLGIYGKSSDFRDIEIAAGYDMDTGFDDPDSSPDKRARLALDVFCYQVAKFIGSYIVALGGLDALIFTAGIGENSPYVRRAICDHLKGIGINIDEQVNAVRAGDFLDITAENSTSKVFVIPTNEELVIARDTMEIIFNRK